LREAPNVVVIECLNKVVLVVGYFTAVNVMHLYRLPFRSTV
jgi:hypothetical protein